MAVRFGWRKCRVMKVMKSRVRFSPNSGPSLLKWLNSLYRPALPEESARALPLSCWVIGASPSGKAGDFDSPMRRFESSRPSQAVRVSENFLLWMRKARQTRAFLVANSLWRPTFELFGSRIPKVSSRIQENSRFLETRPRDPRINPLRGRSGSVIATLGWSLRCSQD